MAENEHAVVHAVAGLARAEVSSHGRSLVRYPFCCLEVEVVVVVVVVKGEGNGC